MGDAATPVIESALSGLNCLLGRVIRDAFLQHFPEVHHLERELVDGTRHSSRACRLRSRVAHLPGAMALYRGMHTRVVRTRTEEWASA